MKRLFITIVLILTIITFSKGVKSQSNTGDLRLSIVNAQKLTNKQNDSIFLGTSITHRAFQDTKYNYIGFVGHSFIDAIKYYNTRKISAENIFIELNLLEKKPLKLDRINTLEDKLKFQVSYRLSDYWTRLIYDLKTPVNYSNEIKHDTLIKCNNFNYNLLLLDDLLKNNFTKENVNFIYIPMSQNMYNFYCIESKINFLKNLGYNVIETDKFSSTTDGLHLDIYGKKIFLNKIN